MSRWRSQGGYIGLRTLSGGNVYPGDNSDNSGQWDIVSPYIKQNLPPDYMGEYQYISPGSHNFTVPANVTSIAVVLVGGGGGGMYYNSQGTTYTYAMQGGGGGALAYLNPITVTPGDILPIVVGGGGFSGAYSTGSTAGGNSTFTTTAGTATAYGGNPGRYAAQILGGIVTLGPFGGSGWNGGSSQYDGSTGNGPAGGGGAGGYTAAGGFGNHRSPPTIAYSGDGGGGGGWSSTEWKSYGGAGVGIFGNVPTDIGVQGGANTPAYGGSGGGDASTANQNAANYGGGGGGNSSVFSGTGGAGGQGAVRIIWGQNRSFPGTNVKLSDSNGNVTVV